MFFIFNVGQEEIIRVESFTIPCVPIINVVAILITNHFVNMSNFSRALKYDFDVVDSFSLSL